MFWGDRKVVLFLFCLFFTKEGGKNTKIHVLLNEKMQRLNVVLTGGQIHNPEPVLELFEGIRLSGKVVLADRAYSCDKIRSYLDKHGVKVTFREL